MSRQYLLIKKMKTDPAKLDLTRNYLLPYPPSLSPSNTTHWHSTFPRREPARLPFVTLRHSPLYRPP